MIVALAGLPQTGKTTLAQALAEAIPAVLLDKAELRRVLFPTRGAASREVNDRLYEFLLQAAVWHLETSPDDVIVLDGRPLTRLRDVHSLRQFASATGQQLHIVECVCPTDLATERGKAFSSTSERDRELVGNWIDESIDPIPNPKIVVNTTLPPRLCLKLALAGIGRAVDRTTDEKRKKCEQHSTPGSHLTHNYAQLIRKRDL